jgi:hypothetical protein
VKYEVIDSTGGRWITEDNPSFVVRHTTATLAVRPEGAGDDAPAPGYEWGLAARHVVAWRAVED